MPRLDALLPLTALVGAASASQPPVIAVPAVPNAVAPVAFTSITGLRELAGGRVVVVDAAERRLVVVDFDEQLVEQVGRQGSGPGEYVAPNRLFPLGAGATGLRDAARQQILVLSALGAPAGTLNSRSPPSRLGTMLLPAPTASAADTLGRLYATISVIHQLPRGRLVPADSFALVRWSVDAPRSDTIASFGQRLPVTAIVQSGYVVSRPGPVEPFRAFVQWAVALDGTIGVVFPDPYRIELISPEDGRRWRSPPIPFSPIRVSEAHKRQWRQAQTTPVVLMVYSGLGAAPYARTIRPTPREPSRWPRTLPPITDSPTVFDRLGRLWVARTTQVGAPPLFDVFSRRGDRVAQVTLPRTTRLAGFGERAIYLIRKAADDLELLQRHALPAGLR